MVTLDGSKLAWTEALGHLPNFKTWALAARAHSRVKEITCMAFILSPQPAENKNTQQDDWNNQLYIRKLLLNSQNNIPFLRLNLRRKQAQKIRKVMAAVCSPVCNRRDYLWGGNSVLRPFYRSEDPQLHRELLLCVYLWKWVIMRWSECESWHLFKWQHCSNKPHIFFISVEEINLCHLFLFVHSFQH